MTKIEDSALLERADALRTKLADIRRGSEHDSPQLAGLGADLDQLRDGIGELLAGYREHEQSLQRDVSEHRLAESELRESRRFIAAILGALTTHVAVLDERGVVIAVNTAWERFESSDRKGSTSIGLAAR